MARRFRALIAGAELFGLTLLGLLGGAFAIASFVPGFGLGMVFLIPWPILRTRKIVDLVRVRTARLTGFVIESPYKPEPPPPVPQADGWYRRDRQLYRRPRTPAMMDRLEWVLGDDATWRDLLWMLFAPATGGLLGAAPALLVGAGVVLPFLGHWWALLLIAAGFLLAPLAVAGSARFNRRLLGGSLLRRDPRVKAEGSRRVRAAMVNAFLPVLKLAVLLLTSVLAAAVFLATVLGLMLGYGIGLFFLVPMVLEDLRWLANWRRSLAKWSGVSIPKPYRQRPVLARNADGLYQVGRNLYETERWAVWAQRWTWVTKDPATWRELLWRGLDPFVGGVLAAVPVAMVGYGIWGLVLPRVTQIVFNGPESPWYGALDGVTWPAIPVGLLLAFAGIKLAPRLLRRHGQWTSLLLKPSAGTVLAQRVDYLTQSRAEASSALDADLRRIERDLHDGTQSRLVAVGMGLAAVERLLDTDPQAARELLAKTRESAATALQELRQVVRGINPPVLAERGLGDAVRAMALDSPLSVTVTLDLPGRLPNPIETAAYFAVAEALGNAAKHAHASKVQVNLSFKRDVLRIVVTDNGRGGADPSRGSGLRGLAQRLGIFDGVVTISSPTGGPTELTMEIPCASSSPRTSTSSGRD